MATSIRFALILASLAFTATTAVAQSVPAGDTHRETRFQLGASVNNAGLQQSVDWTLSRRLVHSDNPWLAQAHVSGGGTLAVTPASLRGGAWVEVAPLSVLVVRAGVDPSHYFGTFDAITSFDRRDAAFDDDARKAAGTAHSARTIKTYVSPTVQMRVGHVAGQVSADFERWTSTATGPFFYEPTRDTLLATHGDRITTVSSALLNEWSLAGGGSLSVGPVHSLMRVNDAHCNQVQRVGGVAMLQMTGRHVGLLAPKATVLVTRYLDDSSKRGQWSAAVALSVLR